MTQYTIGGSVSTGYEAVQEAFEANFIKDREVNSQLCVYVSGHKVVDLWGSHKESSSYNADSLQIVFSSTKNLTSLAIAWLVDRGLLSYTDSIQQHWPQFKYKDSIKVSDVLRHESGLQKFSKSISIEDMQRSNMKESNAVGRLIEMEQQDFPRNNTRRCYHTLTRGWILNELFRRVHPQGLTIGEFFEKDLGEFVGDDVHIGYDSEECSALSRIVDCEMMGMGSLVLQSCLPSKYKKVDLGLFEFASNLFAMRKRMKDVGNNDKPDEISDESMNKPSFADKFLYFNNRKAQIVEIPSGNGTCSARGLAKLASFLSMKGSFDGKELISKETWEKAHSEPTRDWDPMLGANTRFTLGGFCQFVPEEDESGKFALSSRNRDGFYGWMGFGGSVFQWHPEKEIGFAYTPTFLEWYDMVNLKGSALQKTVVECVDKLSK